MSDKSYESVVKVYIRMEIFLDIKLCLVLLIIGDKY